MSCHLGGVERAAEKAQVRVAVLGNPNVGKSTLFTSLTGKITRIGNWPGVTVERREGLVARRGREIVLIDLPGVYGLTATSPEEKVARDYITSGEPDVVLVLIDGTAPERTLYLAVQVLELTPRVVLAVTKADEMEKLGIHVHTHALESALGVPVVLTSAVNRRGLEELLDRLLEVAQDRAKREPLRLSYGPLEPFIDEVERGLTGVEIPEVYPKRWIALKLLEGDPEIEKLLASRGDAALLERARELRDAVRRTVGREPLELAISARYEYVRSLSGRAVVRTKRGRGAELLGRIIEARVVGFAVGATIYALAFVAAFAINTGFPLNLILQYAGLAEAAKALEEHTLSGLLGRGFEALAAAVDERLGGWNPLLASLISKGVLASLGAVLSFAPLVLTVFVILSALEDSGLLVRLALGVDSLMNKFGLTGVAIYPATVSLGCNVPGIMAARTLADETERRQVQLAAPLIPCQARLVVALAVLSAYFASPLKQAAGLFSVYAIGFAAFLATSLAYRRVVSKTAEPPILLLEAPPIHAPNLRVVLWLSWDYLAGFLKRAGTVLFGAGVVLWALMSFGASGLAARPEDSFAYAVGGVLSPLLSPLGLGDEAARKVAVGLVGGFFAKEIFLETIALMQGSADAREALLGLGLSQAQAFSILVFVMLYVPCVATITTLYVETRSLRAALAQAVYTVGLAYVLSLALYATLELLA